ncbi:uncharacterized protein HLK63_M07359 [Nakaseomyces glabratus]|nr:uncharacterized protein GW608_M07359 [Nakaseomyces glabratus]UCS28897.1 uncharacterized protein HLK63_M07359 [Nakaseomyces glabratus]UCS34126.1 uncharacterized protein HLK64_M07359 [Nakaseomyces glabratus]UCS39356.1 uncharacterized protein HLK62_M07359 [Nakaseomyces glabratus]
METRGLIHWLRYYYKVFHRNRTLKAVAVLLSFVLFIYYVRNSDITDKLVTFAGEENVKSFHAVKANIRANWNQEDDGDKFKKDLSASLKVKLDNILGTQNMSLAEMGELPIDAETIEEQKSIRYAKLLKDHKATENSTMGFLFKSLANEGLKPSACIYSFVTGNSELRKLLRTIESVQKKFNHKFGYPWVIISPEPLSEKFHADVEKKLEEFTSAIDDVKTEVEFGTVPPEHWGFPDFIDSTVASNARIDLFDIPNGDSQLFRLINRYNAGLAAHHTLLKKYDWYMRVSPGIRLNCEMEYDIMRWMQDNRKIFGFTLSIKEIERSAKKIWGHNLNFTAHNREFYNPIEKSSLRSYIQVGRDTYNYCSFSTDLQIVNLNFLRSPVYTKYFEYMDKAGGIFYERWSDSIIQSMAYSTMVPAKMIQHISPMGYQNKETVVCPADDIMWREYKCECDQGSDISFNRDLTCTQRYKDTQGMF